MNTVKSSIQRKVFLLTTSITLLSLSIFTAYAVYSFKKDKIKYVYDAHSQYVSSLANQIENELNYTFTSVQQIASFNKDSINDISIKNILRKKKDFVFLNIINESDARESLYTLANSERLKTLQVNLDELNALNLKENDRIISFQDEDLFAYLFKDKLLLVTKKDSSSKKIFYFGFDLSPLHDLLSSSSQYQFSLLSPTHSVILSNLSSTPIDPNHPLLIRAQELKINNSGMHFKMNGEDFLGYYQKILNQLTLTSQLKMASALEDVNTLLIQLILIALVLVALFIFVGFKFSESLSRPLKELMKLTNELAAGNYLIKHDIKSNDEIQDLAQHFKQLGQTLYNREKELEKTTELANRDGLTGLFNNRHFKNVFETQFKLAQRHSTPLSFLIMDVDFFKKFNDTYGHQQGDEVLKELGKILSGLCRSTDLVARYGGEEFVALLNHTDLAGASVFAEKIRSTYEAHDIKNLLDGSIIKSTISIGVTSLQNNNYKNIDEMIAHADDNLYKSKKAGRNRVTAD